MTVIVVSSAVDGLSERTFIVDELVVAGNSIRRPQINTILVVA